MVNAQLQEERSDLWVLSVDNIAYRHGLVKVPFGRLLQGLSMFPGHFKQIGSLDMIEVECIGAQSCEPTCIQGRTRCQEDAATRWIKVLDRLSLTNHDGCIQFEGGIFLQFVRMEKVN